MIRFFSIGIVVWVALVGCDRGKLTSEKWNWKEHQWISGDLKAMTLEAKDTSTVYRMDLDLIYDDTYGFQNLYVRTLTTFPSGKEVSSISSLELINPDGSWAGDCSGNNCTIKLPLQQRFTFPEVGTYQWSIEPYMRMDTIKGIKSLAVTCSKIEE